MSEPEIDHNRLSDALMPPDVLMCCLARDDHGSVACRFSKAGYVIGVAGEDAVAGRGEEYNGRVNRV